MSTVKIGVIGAGMIGDVHIDRIRRDGRGEVTWIAARTKKTLAAKLEKFSIPNGTTNYQEMLQDESLDAVIVAAPPYLHVHMLEDALKAGKHVLLEKPLAVNPEQMRRAIMLVKKYPKQKVVECSCRHARLQPKFAFIKKLIDDGAIGKIYHIHHNGLSRGTFIEYNPAGAWAHRKELCGGGPFIDWGVYDLSFHLGLLNDVPQLTSLRSFSRNGLKPFQIANFYSDIEEHGAAWMEFDTGLTYYYERGSGVQAEIPNETRIFGAKGSLRFAFCSWDAPEVERYWVEHGEEKHETLITPMPDGHDDNHEMAKHFLDVLTAGAEPAMTVDLAAKHLEILYRILDAPRI